MIVDINIQTMPFECIYYDNICTVYPPSKQVILHCICENDNDINDKINIDIDTSYDIKYEPIGHTPFPAKCIILFTEPLNDNGCSLNIKHISDTCIPSIRQINKKAFMSSISDINNRIHEHMVCKAPYIEPIQLNKPMSSSQLVYIDKYTLDDANKLSAINDRLNNLNPYVPFNRLKDIPNPPDTYNLQLIVNKLNDLQKLVIDDPITFDVPDIPTYDIDMSIRDNVSSMLIKLNNTSTKLQTAYLNLNKMAYTLDCKIKEMDDIHKSINERYACNLLDTEDLYHSINNSVNVNTDYEVILQSLCKLTSAVIDYVKKHIQSRTA